MLKRMGKVSISTMRTHCAWIKTAHGKPKFTRKTVIKPVCTCVQKAHVNYVQWQTCSVHSPPVSSVHTQPTLSASPQTRSPTAECICTTHTHRPIIRNVFIKTKEERLFFYVCQLKSIKFSHLKATALTLLVGLQERHPACKKTSGDDGGRHWLVWMEWRPAGWSSC